MKIQKEVDKKYKKEDLVLLENKLITNKNDICWQLLIAN